MISADITHLHSSMDRFEAVVAMENSSVVAIYIPVWIDLKYFRNGITTNSAFHLHSSMDRFEVLKITVSTTQRNYLHSSMDRFEADVTKSV